MLLCCKVSATFSSAAATGTLSIADWCLDVRVDAVKLISHRHSSDSSVYLQLSCNLAHDLCANAHKAAEQIFRIILISQNLVNFWNFFYLDLVFETTAAELSNGRQASLVCAPLCDYWVLPLVLMEVDLRAVGGS